MTDFINIINSDELFSNEDGTIVYQFRNGKYHLIKNSPKEDDEEEVYDEE
jgi:hypothetical protein